MGDGSDAPLEPSTSYMTYLYCNQVQEDAQQGMLGHDCNLGPKASHSIHDEIVYKGANDLKG